MRTVTPSSKANISILDGARNSYSDPVEKGLFNDPADGKSYTSDLEYGNLDEDRFLEAGIGRYPDNISKASILFHRSQQRQLGKDALVAMEYLHSNWPVILATAGGGMRHGETAAKILEKEGFRTKRLVEHRSEPVKFLMSLTPSQIYRFIHTSHDFEEVLRKFVSEGTARTLKNSLLGVKALSYTEQVMEMYFEFDWSTYELDVERGVERVEDLDIPKGQHSGAVIQKAVMKAVYALVWPERFSKINASSLEKDMENKDIIYYQGVGNSNRWLMPDNSSGIVKDRYRKENSFKPEDIPSLERPIVWDNSDMAGKRNAEMRRSFIQKGASAYLGFSGVNYASYSSIIANNFFKTGDRLGSSLIEGVNSLRSSGFIYSPASSHRNSVRRKMERSLVMYGNPEMKKDPIRKNYFNVSRNCEENICTLKAELRPRIKPLEINNTRTLDYSADSYLLEPGAPITPLYRFSRTIPGKIKSSDVEEEYSHVQNLTVPENKLLTHSERYVNESFSYSTFPEKTYRLETGQDLDYVQTGVQKINESYRILERSELEIVYSSPYVLELERQNKTALARINARKQRDVELVYNINGSRGSKNISLTEGQNIVRIANLSEGISQAKVYLIDGTILSKDQEKFKVAEPLNIYLFAPNIRKGNIRQVKAVVENPNSFSVEKKLEIKTGRNIQLDLLEEESRKVELSSDGKRTLNWRITGIKEGKSPVELKGNKEEIVVKEELNHKKIFLQVSTSVELNLQRVNILSGKTVQA